MTTVPSRQHRREAAQDLTMRPGAKLANSRGVPGTLGALAVSLHDKTMMILTSQHVLLGAGAQFGEPVWLTADQDGAPHFVQMGVSSYGRIGIVERGGRVHVDCAVATIETWFGPPPGWRAVPEPEPSEPRPGCEVWADGGASGRSHGVVTESSTRDQAGSTPGQFLVRSLDRRRPFSVEGDSGAVVRDAAGVPLGLLWGTMPSGASIASPIATVVDILGLQLVRLERLDLAQAYRVAYPAGMPR